MSTEELNKLMNANLAKAKDLLVEAQAQIMMDCELFANLVERSEIPDFVKKAFLDSYVARLGGIQQELESK